MRLRFMFWLDLKKADEYELAEEIEHLKEQRSFAQTVRDGIRLVSSLRRGNLDVLEKLFPWVWEQIALQIENQQSKPPENPTAPHLQAQLDRMEQILLQQGAVPVERVKTSDLPSVKPEIADFELEVKQTTNTADNNASWNFMIASAMQVYGNYEALPPEIIDYGVRTGRIPPEKTPIRASKKAEKTLSKATSKSPASGPKAMNVPQFDAPQFDDDALMDNLFG